MWVRLLIGYGDEDEKCHSEPKRSGGEESRLSRGAEDCIWC